MTKACKYSLIETKCCRLATNTFYSVSTTKYAHFFLNPLFKIIHVQRMNNKFYNVLFLGKKKRF